MLVEVNCSACRGIYSAVEVNYSVRRGIYGTCRGIYGNLWRYIAVPVEVQCVACGG